MQKQPTTLFIITLLLLSLLNQSCDDENAFDCIKSTGVIITEKREVGDFNHVYLEDNVNLYLSTETSSTVSIEAGKNIVPKIHLFTRNDTLFISNKNKCNWTRSYKVPINVRLGINQTKLTITAMGYGEIKSLDTLRIPSLTVLSLNGGSNVTLTIRSDEAWIYTNSHASMQVAGEATNVLMWINEGIGRISAENLQAQNCRVINSGSNEIRVFPIQELTAEIIANGTIAYYNEPLKISSTIKGSGKLIKR